MESRQTTAAALCPSLFDVSFANIVIRKTATHFTAVLSYFLPPSPYARLPTFSIFENEFWIFFFDKYLFLASWRCLSTLA